MQLSFSEIRRALCDALTAAFPGSGGDIVDVYQDRCIVRDGSGSFYEVPYTVDASGKVATGDWTRVRKQVDYVVMQVNSLTLMETPPGGAPSEIQLIPFGRHNTPKGPFELTEAEVPLIMGDFERHVNDMVIDFEHQTFADPPVEAPAAGWIKKLVNKGAEGVWGEVEWTPRARSMIENREYRYISPVWIKRREDNRVIALINAGLTNQPNIDGMVPLMNKGITTDKEDHMDKELLKALGLAEGATVAEVIAAINKLREPPAIVANKAVVAALGLPETATEAEITGTIEAMKQSHGSVTDLVSQVNSLTARLSERDATEAVEIAMNAGKITPAQKDWATDYAKRDLAGFKVFADKAPVVVVQNRVVDPKKPEGSAIDETQKEINKLCGVDEETYKKFGPKDE